MSLESTTDKCRTDVKLSNFLTTGLFAFGLASFSLTTRRSENYHSARANSSDKAVQLIAQVWQHVSQGDPLTHNAHSVDTAETGRFRKTRTKTSSPGAMKSCGSAACLDAMCGPENMESRR
jgi:hypothetical protein